MKNISINQIVPRFIIISGQENVWYSTEVPIYEGKHFKNRTDCQFLVLWDYFTIKIHKSTKIYFKKKRLI